MKYFEKMSHNKDMEIAYIQQYRPCEIAYIESSEQFDEQYEDDIEIFPQYAASSECEATNKLWEQYFSVADDSPTPLPLYPDSDAQRITLPFLGDRGDPSLADDASTLDAMLGRVYQKEYITAARGFEVDGNIVIAALTEPFFLKSERDEALKSLENELNDISQSASVTVCFDFDLYRRIEEDMSRETMLELFNIARARLGQR